jgi:hypothetical protein
MKPWGIKEVCGVFADSPTPAEEDRDALANIVSHWYLANAVPAFAKAGGPSPNTQAAALWATPCRVYKKSSTALRQWM